MSGGVSSSSRSVQGRQVVFIVFQVVSGAFQMCFRKLQGHASGGLKDLREYYVRSRDVRGNFRSVSGGFEGFQSCFMEFQMRSG